LDHYYAGIRKSAATSLFTFIGTFYDLSDPEEWKAGATIVSLEIYPSTSLAFDSLAERFFRRSPFHQSTPLHANVKQLVDVVLPAILARWDSEDDR